MNITEEQVREEAKRIIGQCHWLAYGSSDCDYIEFTGRNLRYWVRRNLIITRSKNKSALEEHNKEYTLDEFMQTDNLFKHEIESLEALLHPSEPTLQEQVEGYVEFNISDKVMVRLTDCGRKHLEDDAQSIPEESDGWSEWQLWDLANTFGTLLFNGCDVPFETRIRIPLSEIAPSSLESQIAEQQRVIEGLREELKTEGDKWAQSFKILKDKNLALEEQLQGCVSQADHEAVIQGYENTSKEYEQLLSECYLRVETYQFGIEEAYKQIQREREQREEMPF